MHYCMGGCGKYLGYRGFCSKECRDAYYSRYSEEDDYA